MQQGLSIIIVNYNGRDFLETCVESCRQALLANDIPHEFLIIDNASADGSAALLSRLEADIPHTRVFAEAVNHGFGKANNLMARLARYETLVLLNNDTQTLSLHALAGVFNSGSLEKHHVYTCRLLNADRSLQKNTFHYPRLFNVMVEVYLVKKPLFKLYSLLFKKRLEIPDGYYSGCFLVLNRELFLQAGGFDEAFFFYHEECDLFLRMERTGIQKAILDDELIHFGSGGAGISDFAFKNYYQNLARLLIKHRYGRPASIKRLFRIGFRFRIFLLRLGFNIPYSPFSHIYDGNKTSHQAQSRPAIIALHRQTLQAIEAINVSAFF